MFVGITSSGGRRYVKLVESYRVKDGTPRQRVIATLGRVETVCAGENNALINGLLRAAGRPTMDDGTGDVSFAPALSVGDTWMLTALWKEVGFADAFRRILRPHHQFDAERLLRVMVFNRLCDPKSKLGFSRWLEGALVCNKNRVRRAIAGWGADGTVCGARHGVTFALLRGKVTE